MTAFAASEEKTVIEYWHCNAETQGGLAVEELVQKFNETNDHIEVVAKYNPDMYKGLMQNLQAEAATGNYPALVQIGWAFLDYFSNNFAYVTPQDAIDAYDKEDPTFLQDKFLPNILELAVNSEGSQVGIPYSLSTPVLYINRDLLREAGLPEEGPATWEEVDKFARTVTEKTGKYGFYMQEPADFWAQQGLIESNGASMLSEDENGNVQASFATEEGIDDEAILRALESFQGTGRRFDFLGEFPLEPVNGKSGTAMLVDDYGHHPTEVDATIKAARAGWPDKNLVMLFQPHRFTRTRDLYDDFANVLTQVDTLLMLEVYPAGEAPIPGADSRSLCRTIRGRGKIDPILVPDPAQVAEMLAPVLTGNDLILVQGAGNIGKIARSLAEIKLKPQTPEEEQHD